MVFIPAYIRSNFFLHTFFFSIQTYFHWTIQLAVIVAHKVIYQHTDLNLAWSQIRLPSSLWATQRVWAHTLWLHTWNYDLKQVTSPTWTHRWQNPMVKFGHLWSHASLVSLWTPWHLIALLVLPSQGESLGGWCRACSATVLGLCWGLGDAGSRGGSGHATPRPWRWPAWGRCGHRRQKQEQAWDCCDLGPDQPSPEHCKIGERLNLAFPAVPLV